MRELLSSLMDTSGLLLLYQPEALLYLVLVVALLWLGKLVYQRTVPYDLMAGLADDDNKAIALSFAGFLFGLGLALWGALTAHGLPSLLEDLVDMSLLGLLAMALLYLGQRITDWLVFPQFRLRELIAERNLAAGVVEAGGYVSTGLILRAAVGLHGVSFSLRLVETLIFFLLAQLAFVLFVRVHQWVTRYDVHAELKRGNSAAGVSEALTFVGQGILLAHAISESHSLPLFATWFLLGSVLLIAFRFFVDRLLLPGHSLDSEVAVDQNWGVALLEGSGAVLVSFVLTGAF